MAPASTVGASDVKPFRTGICWREGWRNRQTDRWTQKKEATTCD